MGDILKFKINGLDSYIGLTELDNCAEVMDMFYDEGEIIKNSSGENIFIVKNTPENFEELWNTDYYSKGDKIAFENCDYLGFTGVNK